MSLGTYSHIMADQSANFLEEFALRDTYQQLSSEIEHKLQSSDLRPHKLPQFQNELQNEISFKLRYYQLHTIISSICTYQRKLQKH